ncbi:zinc-binding dehydrogenase [candidate division NPL-UPA2 bacterium]|nr:zinc-binding dehydrogenase [candidate division NPL-UPA2 bacterium]
MENIPVPEVGPVEVLVRIKAALTCGTDAKVYLRGGHPRMIKPPAVFGHEFSGVITKVGNGVDYFKEGMRVVAANSAPCNRCFYCKLGRQSLCENLLFINGAYAEYVKIPEPIVRQNLLEIPEGVSFKEAALVEPLACALHGVEESRMRLGDTVVINGAGPMGLLFTQLAKLKGTRVIVADKKEDRLSLARVCRADRVVNVSEVNDPVKAVRELAEDGRGVDVAVEAVGIPEVWEATIAMARKGGSVVLFGGCAPGTSIKLDTKVFHYGELTLTGVFHHTPAYVKKALDLIVGRAINASPLITQELPLSQLPRALEMIVNKQGMKTAIIP